MQITFDALDKNLKQGLHPVYVITSDEVLLVLEAADKIRAAAKEQAYLEREIYHVERAFKWGCLQAVNQSLSLFGDKKMIDLRIPTGKPGKEGGAALIDYINHHSPDNLTLITLPKLDWVSQKANWVQHLQRQTVYIDIPLIERNQLPQWIQQRLAKQKQSCDDDTLQFMVDKVEGNLLAAHQEIQKLGLLYPEGLLSFDDVHDAVLNVARYDVFKLNEAMLTGDVARLIRMLEGLRNEGEALPLVLWAVSDEIRTLLKMKLALNQGKSISIVLTEFRIRGLKQRWCERALQRLSLHRIEQALSDCAQVDKMIKGLKVPHMSADAWDALQQVALQIAKPI